MNRIIVIGLLVILGFATGVQATSIDFRSDDFNTVDNASSFIYSPAGLTIESLPGGTTLYWDSKDGIGVRYGYETDEIEGNESLHLYFDTKQQLQSILITDLFNEPYKDGTGSYLEKGSYSFDNIFWTEFVADASQIPTTNGVLTLNFSSPIMMTNIWFKAPGHLNNGNEGHEFSVAGIDVSPVPEPATMLLLGAGLVGLSGFRRKFKKS